MVQMLVIQEVDTKNDVQAPTTFTIAASDNTPVEGETVTLTSSIVLDNRRDEIVSYQWYKDGVRIAGANKDTYSFVAGTATDGDYTLEITVYNDRVNGVAEKTFTSAKETVTSSEVVRSMDVYVTYVDSTGNPISGLSKKLVEGVVADAGKSYVDLSTAENSAKVMAGLDDYAFVSADPVAFEDNGFANVNVTVKQVRFALGTITAGSGFTGWHC